jgi:hypothetical protein
MVATPRPRWFDEIRDCDGSIPEEVFASVVADGEDARPHLLDLLMDPSFREPEDPDSGWAAVHAAELLGRLPPQPGTVDALLATMRSAASAGNELLASVAMHELAGCGEAAVPATLAALAASGSEAEKNWCLDVLSRSGARSDAVYDLLLAHLAAEPGQGAMWLAEYGDARAVPALHEAFARHRFERGDSLLANQDLFEIEDAILELGGELSPREIELLDEVRRARRAWAGRLERAAAAARSDWRLPVNRPAVARLRVGPNEPCPCGSGRKSKKCCGDDVSAPTGVAASAPPVPRRG